MTIRPDNIRDNINRFLAEPIDVFADGRRPRKSLADIIAFNQEDPTNRIPYGQDQLKASETN